MEPLELIAVDVRADLDTLERDMSGAARVVDVNAKQMAASVQRAEQSIVRSSNNAGDAMAKTGGISRVLGQQFSQMGQQIAAGTNPLQAIAIQLPDIAIGMQQVGGSAGALASFFGGPWGVALTTAAAVAVALAPAILGIGDAADETSSALDNMIKKLRQAKAEQGAFKSAGADLNALVKRRGELEAEINQRGVRNANGQLQFVYKQQQELAEVNKRIAEGREALDASRTSALHLGQTAADVIYDINNPDVKKTRTPRTRTPRAPAKTDAERAAEAAAKENARQDALYDKTKRQLELEQTIANLRAEGADRAADKLEVISRLQEQFPKLANSSLKADQDRLAVLTAIAVATVDEAHNRSEAKDAAEEQAKLEKQLSEQRKKDADELARKQEQQVRTLAGLYEDAFRGGTAAIWADFKTIGLAVVAQVLARFTLAKLSGNSFDLGGAISSAIGAALPGFASGGSLTIAGRGGTDSNVLALNGRPIANVSRGETLNIGARAGRGGGGNTQIIQIDARGAVMNDQFADMILARANSFSAQASQAAYAGAVRDTPALMAKRSRLG